MAKKKEKEQVITIDDKEYKARLVSTGTIGYHPICSVKAYSGLSSGLTAEDISITWS